MRRALLPALLLVAGCGGPSEPFPADDVHVDVRLDREEVAFGEPFEVTVVRAWRADLRPTEWNGEVLAPLALKPLDTRVERNDTHVRETRRFEARAFAREPVRIAPFALFAERTGGGAGVEVFSEERELDVRPVLDAAVPGPVEAVPGPLDLPTRWAGWMSAFGLVVAFAVLLLGREQTTDTLVRTTDPDPRARARERARERLEELRDRVAGDDMEFHGEAVALLRAFIGGATRVPTRSQTSGEILRRDDVRRLTGDGRFESLRGVFRDCDLVKFAAARSDQAGHEDLIERIDGILGEPS